MKVDWKALAIELATLTNFGGEIGGSEIGTQTLEHILGAEFFEQAVEHYISCAPGSELARSVLTQIETLVGHEILL